MQRVVLHQLLDACFRCSRRPHVSSLPIVPPGQLEGPSEQPAFYLICTSLNGARLQGGPLGHPGSWGSPSVSLVRGEFQGARF